MAFTTPPIAAYPSLDAKFTTTDLARQLKSWALFGPPLGRTWEPTQEDRQRYPEIKPLVSNPWTILHANPPAKSPGKEVAVDLPRVKQHEDKEDKDDEDKHPALLNVPAWHGTLLPHSDGDIWLATAFAEYQKYVAKEKALCHEHSTLTQADKDELAVDLFAWQSAYGAAARCRGDNVALTALKMEWTNDDWYSLAAGKGVLVLHELRSYLGDPLFEETMDAFGRANAGKKVTTAQFQAFVEKKTGKPLDAFVRSLNSSTLLGTAPAFSILSFHSDQEHSLIVCGTRDEVPTNREAAVVLQKSLRESWQNHTVPIKTDKEVTEADLKSHHLLLVGRPDSNAIAERFRARLPVAFGSGSFVVAGKTYANPASAVLAAADNPLNPRFSMVLVAGLSAESTVSAPAKYFGHRGQRPAEVLVLPADGQPQALSSFAPASAGRDQDDRQPLIDRGERRGVSPT